jgi:competence protein ComEC
VSFATGIWGGLWLATIAHYPVHGGPVLDIALSAFTLLAAIITVRAPRYPAIPLAVLWLAGLGAGAINGARARSSCLARLESGVPIIATGILQDRLPGVGGGEGRGNVALGGATLGSGGRLCRVGRVRVTLPLAESAREAGATVLLKGVWRQSGDAGLPRAVERYGFASATSVESPDLKGGGAELSLFIRTRAGLAARLERRLPDPNLAAIGKALLLADRTTLSRETRQRFVDAGVVHLLAISGLHVGMIAGAITWVIGFVEPGRRRWIMSAGVVTAYVVMIGAPPAATRAGLVFWGHAYCRWRDRPSRVADLAGAGALVALGANPLLLTDPGFQLSFAGFAGVIVGHGAGGRIAASVRRPRGAADTRAARWRRRIAPLTDAMISSAGAFVMTAPIAALHFGRVVATSIPASVASTGIVALAIPSVAATALLPGPAGRLAGEAAGALLVALDAVAGVFASAPLKWRATTYAGWLWVVCMILGVGLLKGRRSRRLRYGLALAVTLSLPLGSPTVRRIAGRNTPLLCHLDVGQGDAAVVRTGSGRWLVFDAGPGTSILDGRAVGSSELRIGFGAADAGRDVIAPFLRARGVRDIELLALSHPHLDHFGGSGALLDGFRVRHVLDPGVPEPSVAYLAFLERVGEERAVWIRGLAGDVIRIDDLRMRVLWPVLDAGTDANETSLSFRIDLGPLSYVNTGDAPVETEAAILDRVELDALRANLLKLGHHGSKTSSSVSWLRAVRPDIALMSLARDNRYGHPHAATLARLDSAGVRRVWRTDRDGTLCLEVGPDGWQIVDP